MLAPQPRTHLHELDLGRVCCFPPARLPCLLVRLQYDNSAPRDLADAVFLRNSGVPSGVIVVRAQRSLHGSPTIYVHM